MSKFGIWCLKIVIYQDMLIIFNLSLMSLIFLGLVEFFVICIIEQNFLVKTGLGLDFSF